MLLFHLLSIDLHLLHDDDRIAVLPKKTPKGTGPILSVVTLVNTVVGAGTLGLPYAFAKAGLVPSLSIFFTMLSLTILSVYYVVHVSDCTLLFSYGEVCISIPLLVTLFHPLFS